MIRAFFRSKEWFWWAYGTGTLFIICKYIQVSLLVKLNSQYGYIFDLFQGGGNHLITDLDAALKQLIQIIAALIIMATVTNQLGYFWAFGWRYATTLDLIKRSRNKEIEGSSQRIQDDMRQSTEIVELLVPQIVNFFLTIAAFTSVLWRLSYSVEIKYLKDIPGSLMWIVFAASGGGIFISWLVGKKLSEINYDIRASEASFRKELVYNEDDSKDCASVEVLNELFVKIWHDHRRLFLHNAYFDLWRNLYSQFMLLLALILVGPDVFKGLITWGILAKVSDSIEKTYKSVAPFIDDWEAITKLRGIWWHMQEFEAELQKGEKNNLTTSP